MVVGPTNCYAGLTLNVNSLSEHLRLEKIGLEVHQVTFSCFVSLLCLVYYTQAEEQQQERKMPVIAHACVLACTFHVYFPRAPRIWRDI